MKKLCRFYCVDCDNAWVELLSEHDKNSEYVDKCDYCAKKIEAEEVQSESE